MVAALTMKPVAFLRNSWRRKEHKSIPSAIDVSYTPPESHPQSLSRTSDSSSSSTASTPTPTRTTFSSPPKIAPATSAKDSRNHEKTSSMKLLPETPHARERTRSFGSPQLLGKSTHGPPHNSMHGPPHNTFHGPLSPNLPSFNPVTPPRPPRPPPLDLNYTLSTPPSVGQSSSSPGSHHLHIKFSTPPKSTSPRSRTSPSSPLSVRAKRSMPELDGVWQGFLQEVEEDSESITSGILPFRGSSHDQRKERHSQLSQRHTQSVVGPQLVLEPPSSPTLSRRSQQYTVVGRERKPVVPRKPSLPTVYSNSATSLPYIRDDYDEYTYEAITRTPSPESEELGMPPTFSLSLFPPPPPLSIRKKASLQPLVLRPTPTNTPPPPSPSLTITPDTTPVTTPTTPRFTLGHCSRKTGSPVSILRRGPPPPNHFSPPTSPLPTPPVSPDSLGFLPKHRFSPLSPHRPLRLAQSSNDLRTEGSKLSASHRTTSSDSTSDHSTTIDSGQETVYRRGTPQLCPKHVPAPKSEVSRSYLQSSGRRAPRPILPPDTQVQWGYAV